MDVLIGSIILYILLIASCLIGLSVNKRNEELIKENGKLRGRLYEKEEKIRYLIKMYEKN